MTHQDLATILAHWEGVEHQPVFVAQFPEDVDPIGYFTDCYAKSAGGTTVHGVVTHDRQAPLEESAIWTCMTGNGLTSAAHARFYAMCHTAIPALVAEIQRLWKATPPHPLVAEEASHLVDKSGGAKSPTTR